MKKYEWYFLRYNRFQLYTNMRKQKSFIIITVSKQFKWVVAAVKVWGGGGVATVNFTRKGTNWLFSTLVTSRLVKDFLQLHLNIPNIVLLSVESLPFALSGISL